MVRCIIDVGECIRGANEIDHDWKDHSFSRADKTDGPRETSALARDLVFFYVVSLTLSAREVSGITSAYAFIIAESRKR